MGPQLSGEDLRWTCDFNWGWAFCGLEDSRNLENATHCLLSQTSASSATELR